MRVLQKVLILGLKNLKIKILIKTSFYENDYDHHQVAGRIEIVYKNLF